ncbi:MAG: hypothetical protein ACEQSA_05080 [Weeksellaceae bacterium]
MDNQIAQLQQIVWSYYRENKRLMPWREHIDPYWVVVTEIMLQQTQVPRVMTKFPEFLKQFPDFATLASASLPQLLGAWQGMGYNRRAKYLQQIAEKIVHEHNGILPQDPELLEKLPGIGPATARSIIVYSYNLPLVFIETNIRRIFIHHFFSNAETVHDRDIYPLVEKSLDTSNPREWYYALMDYGTYLGKTVPNPNRKSKHYTKQSSFQGSKRKIRGEILRMLLQYNTLSEAEILQHYEGDEIRAKEVLMDLIKEQFIKQKDNSYTINHES